MKPTLTAALPQTSAIICSLLLSACLGTEPATETRSFSEQRAAFHTQLVSRSPAPQDYDEETPPEGVEVVEYSSGSLQLKAWLWRPAEVLDAAPGLVFLHGGFAFGAGDLEAARLFHDAGMVVLAPMLRGENGNPGHFELFLGELDDAAAAVRWLASQPFVEQGQVYAFGHSVGGGLAGLLSLVDDVPLVHTGSSGGLYGPWLFEDWSGIAPFDPTNPDEVRFRLLVLNLDHIVRPHHAYIGSQDEGQLDAVDYALDAGRGLEASSLHVANVPGDHYTSFAAAAEAYLGEIESSLQ